MKKTAGFTGLVCVIVISLSVHGVNSALFIRENCKEGIFSIVKK